MRLKLAIKWPYGDEWGWVIGTFKRMSTNAKYKHAFVITWEDGEQSYWPKEPTAQYGTNKKWVLIRAS